MNTIALPNAVYWIRWAERVAAGVGYVFSRGALLAIGAGITWLGYAYGSMAGNDEGFLAGCRATTTDSACLYATDVGKQILKIRMSVLPGKALTSSQSTAIAVMCDDLRDGLSRRAAEHYGCDKP